MSYIKNLFNSVIPVIKYMVYSYIIIFISFIFCSLMGYTDINNYLINIAPYIIIIFHIVYAIILLKNNKFLCKKTKPLIPFILLGISYSCFFNMIIIKLKPNDPVSMNILLLLLSGVILGPLVEEIIFRYLLTNKISKFNSKILTIILSSLIFSLMHNGIINNIYTFILGLILNTIYLKNKNLLYPLIVHASANLATIFLTGYNEYILTLSFILLIISMLIVKRDYLLK